MVYHNTIGGVHTLESEAKCTHHTPRKSIPTLVENALLNAFDCCQPNRSTLLYILYANGTCWKLSAGSNPTLCNIPAKLIKVRIRIESEVLSQHLTKVLTSEQCRHRGRSLINRRCSANGGCNGRVIMAYQIRKPYPLRCLSKQDAVSRRGQRNKLHVHTYNFASRTHSRLICRVSSVKCCWQNANMTKEARTHHMRIQIPSKHQVNCLLETNQPMSQRGPSTGKFTLDIVDLSGVATSGEV